MVCGRDRDKDCERELQTVGGRSTHLGSSATIEAAFCPCNTHPPFAAKASCCHENGIISPFDSIPSSLNLNPSASHGSPPSMNTWPELPAPTSVDDMIKMARRCWKAIIFLVPPPEFLGDSPEAAAMMCSIHDPATRHQSLAGFRASWGSVSLGRPHHTPW